MCFYKTTLIIIKIYLLHFSYMEHVFDQPERKQKTPQEERKGTISSLVETFKSPGSFWNLGFKTPKYQLKILWILRCSQKHFCARKIQIILWKTNFPQRNCKKQGDSRGVKFFVYLFLSRQLNFQYIKGSASLAF